MSNPSQPNNPQTSLEEIKRRMSIAQEVVVDQEGVVRAPDDPKVATVSPQEKTVVKPQRWF